ncbi:HAD-IA family hydrolase [Kitasatospora sp. NPDC049285]|uniref:HAD family hydrolase n=1 Tax=Kitasatospora sp. NPDC049285 TaxID=3157096 RepID=UPI003426A69F
MTTAGVVPQVEAVLCDLDGVLRIWEPLESVDLAYGLAPGTVAGAAFRPERLGPAITGMVTDEQWRQAVAGDLTAVCGSAAVAREVVAAWGRQASEVDEQVLALLGEARRRATVVLLSNGTTRLERDLLASGLDRAVDAVVNTARVGVAKPDPAVYRIAAERAGVAVEHCLFVDDGEKNVTAAEAVGMSGHWYRGVAGLRAAFAAAGLVAAG